MILRLPLFASVVAVCLMALPAQAQVLLWEQTYGNNVVRPRGPMEWNSVATTNFDLYYYNAHQPLAQRTAGLAEQALHALREELDYAPANRIMLRVYASAADYLSAFDNPDAYPEEQPHLNQVDVYFTGDAASFYKHIKTRLADLYIRDMFYGEGGSRVLQTRATLHLPRWFREGLAAYTGEGWTAEDEQIIRSIRERGTLGMVSEQDNSATAHTLRKSIWYFLETRFKRQRIRELLYMVRLTRSVEGGFASTVGTGVNTFTDYWADFIHTYADGPRQDSFLNARRLNLVHRGERLISAGASASLKQVAVVVEQGGIFRVRVYDRTTRTSQTLPYRWNARMRHSGLVGLRAPVAWSPDGKRLAFVADDANGLKIIYWEAQTGVLKPVNLPEAVTAVNHLAWAPDGRQLALSAARDGQSDLLLTVALSERFVPLTADGYDDLMPTWSADGARVLFSSNRDTALSTTNRRASLKCVFQPFDIYAIKVETKVLERLTQTPVGNDWMAVAAEDGSLRFFSDENGQMNLYVGVGQPITDFDFGVTPYTITSNGLLYTGLREGRLSLLVADTLATQVRDPLTPTTWAQQRQDAFTEEQNRRQQALQDSLRQAQTDSLRQIQQDSLDSQRDSRRNQVRYYLFDEETPDSLNQTQERTQRRYRRASQRINAQRARHIDFNPDAVAARPIGPYRTFLQLQRSHISIGAHPLFKMWSAYEFEVIDPFRYHRFTGGGRLYRDLRSTDIWGQYRYEKFRVNFGGYALRQARRYNDYRVFQLRHFALGGFASYPFSQALRLEGGLEFQHFSRDELIYTDQNRDLIGEAQFLAPYLNLVYDNTRREGDYMLSGNRTSLRIQPQVQTGGLGHRFSQIRLDSRQYLSVGSSLTFAFRLQGGVSAGPDRQLFVIGGVNDWAIKPGVDNASDIPLTGEVYDFLSTSFAGPIRGTSYNARNGTQFGILNMEMRVPLKRLLNAGLPDNRQHHWVWYAFWDVGTAWVSGNPFSQRNPINVDYIQRPPFTITVQSLKSPFAQGVGTGLQGYLFGIQGRADVAFPIEDGNVGAPRLMLSFGRSF